MTVTKERLIESISSKNGVNRGQSEKAIETFLEIIKESLENGEDILISGFGKFCVRSKDERKGRNPVTGEDLMLGPRRVVIFKSSGVLRKKINGGK